MSLRDEVALYTELSGNDGNHTPIGTIGAYLDGYEKGKASVPEPHWIPCSERLPDNEVLCCDNHGEMMLGYVFACDDGKTPYSAENEHEYMYDCVAWMPLPEPYKEGTE